MKLLRSPCLGALITVLSATAYADECTDVQYAQFDKAASDAAFADSCERVLAATSITGVDVNALASLNPCGDPTCIAYLQKLGASAPDCEVSGLNLPATFDLLFRLCDLLPTNLPAFPSPVPTTVRPTSTTKTPTPTTDPVPDDLMSSRNETASEMESERETAIPTTRPTTRPTPAPANTQTALPDVASSKPPPQSAATTTTAAMAAVVALMAFLAMM